jgi:hypothetical protein
MVIMGVTIAKVPNPHLNPEVFKKLDAIGPPIQTVIMYGDEMKANAKPLLFKDDVSATKMPMV